MTELEQHTFVDDEEPVYHFCKACGWEMDWADCWMIDCEDGEYDAHDQDCINFGPGSYRTCETCEGAGGWWYCQNKDCSAKGKEVNDGR